MCMSACVEKERERERERERESSFIKGIKPAKTGKHQDNLSVNACSLLTQNLRRIPSNHLFILLLTLALFTLFIA